MAQIKFTDQAINDLNDIASYITSDSQYYASLQIQKLFKRTEVLETLPFIGRIVPELKIRSIREIIEGNYRIIYRIINRQEVHVLTIHHSKRRLKKTDLKQIIKKSR